LDRTVELFLGQSLLRSRQQGAGFLLQLVPVQQMDPAEKQGGPNQGAQHEFDVDSFGFHRASRRNAPSSAQTRAVALRDQFGVIRPRAISTPIPK
jgi:hypothetical protein